MKATQRKALGGLSETSASIAARRVAGTPSRANILLLLARYYVGTTVTIDGRPAVAKPCARYAEECAYAERTARRAVEALHEAGLIVATHRRWRRAPRVYIEVPRSTYEALGVEPPPRCDGIPELSIPDSGTRDLSQRPSGSPDSGTRDPSTAALESADSGTGDRSQRHSRPLLDLNTKKKIPKTNTTASPCATRSVAASGVMTPSAPVSEILCFCGGRVEPTPRSPPSFPAPPGSPPPALPDSSPGEVDTMTTDEHPEKRGKPGGFRRAASRKVADAHPVPVPDGSLPPSRLWLRHARKLGYRVPDDPKTGRHVKLLVSDLRRAGMNPSEEIPRMIERWGAYRGDDMPVDPLPWAVRRRLSAYRALVSNPAVSSGEDTGSPAPAAPETSGGVPPAPSQKPKKPTILQMIQARNGSANESDDGGA